MRGAVLATIVTLVMLVPAVHAQGILLEAYTHQRPEDVRYLLAPLHEALTARGFTLGGTLGRAYDQRISHAARTEAGLSPDFEASIERGHKAWI